MIKIALPWLVNFMPLIVAAWGWFAVWRIRRSQPVHPFAWTLLGVVTVLAGVAGGSFVYFAYKPVSGPPWESPQIALLGWFFLLGPACMLLGGLAYRREPKWLFWIVELSSFGLFGLGVLASLAY
jgi:hypothetical protein